MADTWAQLRTLFDEAVLLDGAERQNLLQQRCAGDDGLLRAVNSLLEADEQAGSFLAAPLVPAPEAAEPWLKAVATAEPTDANETAGSESDPTSIGPYRILRRLGQGGMGVVYLAARADDTFQRRVVVKLVRHDLHDEDLLRRLRTERQILASLDHPNIAHLYDGGTTSGSRPYFVMEYVEGVPIDKFCDQQQLSIDERLSLFRQICSAVHYAHQNLIIHRDLKPSNILVTAEGVPKLLDFGIAKLRNPELTARELEATATWMRLMTPQYASPEQVRGKLVSTASDVYSLGILLFELLTGQRPFRFDDKSPREIERILTEHDPPRPSSVVTGSSPDHDGPGSAEVAAELARVRHALPGELVRRLAGDLDAIVLKTLRTAAHRRYASAEHLAADLECYQNGEPVLARQGTVLYRATRLLSRYRLAFTLTALALAMLIAFTMNTARQSARVARERDQAELERQRKETVLELLMDVLRVADPYVGTGDELTVRQALDASRGPLEQRLREHPALRAELLHTTGRVYFNLGLWQQARADLAEALRVRRGLFGDAHHTVTASRGLLGVVLAELGEQQESLQMTLAAVATSRAGGSNLELLESLNHHVTALCLGGDYKTAGPLAEESLSLAREEPEGDFDLLVRALYNQAAVYLNAGEHLRAAELFGQSLELLESLYGEHHASLADPLNNLAASLRRAGDLDGAEKIFRRTLEIQRRALGEEHPALPRTLNNLAAVAMQRGEPDVAFEHWREARGLLLPQIGAEHSRMLYLDLQMQRARVEAGEAAEVLSWLQRQLPPWLERLGPYHRFLLMANRLEAQALLSQGRYSEAEALLKSALESLSKKGLQRDMQLAVELLREVFEATDQIDLLGPYLVDLEANANSGRVNSGQGVD